jgi:hypothetical protein
MVVPMRRLILFALVAAPALAVADTPTVGMPWVAPTSKTWLEGTPTPADAAGKVVVYWYCKPKSEPCKDDLARLYNMREQGNVYVVAYIAGSKADAKKLDPVRSEVGAGAVAYGPAVAKTMAKLGLSAPTSIVVDTDGRVALITAGGDPDALDGRDQKVAALLAAIKEFTVKGDGPSQVKPGESFQLKVDVQLASWLTCDTSVKPAIKLTVPPDVTCQAGGAPIVGMVPATIDGGHLSAAVDCKGAVKGSYEARFDLRFGYRAPNKAVGVGQDAVSLKFQVKP